MSPCMRVIVAAMLLGYCPSTPQLFGAPRLNSPSDSAVDLSNTDPRLTEYVRRHQALGRRYDKDASRIDATDKAGSLEQMLELAREIERDWGKLQSDQSAQLLGATATSLVRRFRATPEAVSLAIQLGNAALDRIKDIGSQAAQNLAMGTITGGPNSDPEDRTKVASYLDRTRVLDAELSLFQLAAACASVPLADQLKPFEDKTSPATITFGQFQDAEHLERVVKQIENYYRYEELKYQYKFLTETNAVYGAPRLDLYPRQIGRFVRARFDRSVDDLKQVRHSLQSRITDPILRDKLMIAIYGSENPFLALPEDSVGAGGGPSLEALTKKSAASVSSSMASGSSHGPAAPASAPATGETTQSTSLRSLPYLPLAGVLAAGLVLWWFLTRSRPG